MQVFATRAWGFDPEEWPVITFGLEGNRDGLLRRARPGDRIVIVGTQDAPTPVELRGRLLGMAEIGRIAVDTLDVVDPARSRPENFEPDGRFKWPKAILMLRAWRFTPQPLLKEVLKDQLPYAATPSAVLLDPDDTSAVLGLSVVEAVLARTETANRALLLDEALTAGSPTKGVKPTTWSGTTGRDASQGAHTYAFRFGKSDLWKIGHAVSLRDRLKDVNKHVPEELYGERWAGAYAQAWPSEERAYEMEQRVLELLDKRRTQNERVRCSEAELERAWFTAMGIGRV